jgi:hypothetical protein
LQLNKLSTKVSLHSVSSHLPEYCQGELIDLQLGVSYDAAAPSPEVRSAALRRSKHRTNYLSARFNQPTEDTIMKALLAMAVVGLGLISTLSPASSQPYGFDERDYLRCNPDVRAAVRRGEFRSGFHHYQTFGRREGRRLHCRWSR